MKNRKRVITAFLLIACMLIGVGYAAVTNTLDIQGSADVSQQAAEDEFNEDIYFTGVKVADDTFKTSALFKEDGSYDESKQDGVTYTYSANINSNNNDKAQFTVKNLKNADDSQTITYQIKNDSAHDAEITLKSITNTNGSTQGEETTGAFDFDYYFATKGTKEATISAGSTVEVTVVVTLRNQVTTAVSASFILELNATAD